MIKMTNTEWLCRGCESDITKMIKVQELIPPRVSETGHVIEGVPASVYFKDGVCEKCGVSTLIFEYEVEEVKEVLQEEAPEETVLVAEDAPIEEEVVVPEPEIPEEVVEENVEAAQKTAEIEALKAQIAELEK